MGSMRPTWDLASVNESGPRGPPKARGALGTTSLPDISPRRWEHPAPLTHGIPVLRSMYPFSEV